MLVFPRGGSNIKLSCAALRLLVPEIFCLFVCLFVCLFFYCKHMGAKVPLGGIKKTCPCDV